jgi:hypothetical protein
MKEKETKAFKRLFSIGSSTKNMLQHLSAAVIVRGSCRVYLARFGH